MVMMKIGDVVVRRGNHDSDLRWVGVVTLVHEGYAEAVVMCIDKKPSEGRSMLLWSIDCNSAYVPEDVAVIGHIDDGLLAPQVAEPVSA